MKTIYGFTYNYRHYRSTEKEMLELFAWSFSMVVNIEVVGSSSHDIELERAD